MHVLGAEHDFAVPNEPAHAQPQVCFMSLLANLEVSVTAMGLESSTPGCFLPVSRLMCLLISG